jgi:hypothetical protein
MFSLQSLGPQYTPSLVQLRQLPSSRKSRKARRIFVAASRIDRPLFSIFWTHPSPVAFLLAPILSLALARQVFDSLQEFNPAFRFCDREGSIPDDKILLRNRQVVREQTDFWLGSARFGPPRKATPCANGRQDGNEARFNVDSGLHELRQDHRCISD